MIKSEKLEVEIDLTFNKLKSIVESGYGKIKNEWTCVGHPIEEIFKKELSIEGKLKIFFKELYNEEIGWRKEKERELEELRITTKDLIIALKKEEPEFIQQEGIYKGGIYQFEKRLKQFHNLLKLESIEKSTVFYKLFRETKRICKDLDEKFPKYLEVEHSENVNDEIITKLNFLNKLIKRKQEELEIKIKEMRTKAVELYTQLGTSPKTEKELNIIHLDRSINKQLVDDLTVLLENLKMKTVAAIEEKEILCSKIFTLAGLCGKPDQKFPPGISIVDLTKLKERLTELANERKSNIEKLLGDAVGNITELKNLLLIPELSQDPPSPTTKSPSKSHNHSDEPPEPSSSFFKEEDSKNDKNKEKIKVEKTDMPQRRIKRQKSDDEIEIVETKQILRREKIKRRRKIEEINLEDSDEGEIEILQGPNKNVEIVDLPYDSSDEEQNPNEGKTPSMMPRFKNPMPYTKAENITMLKIVGASKWHGYIHGVAVWEDVAERNIIERRTGRSMHWHFIHCVLKNFDELQVSEAEQKRYEKAIGEMRYNLVKPPPPPFNPAYIKYEI